jgi:recombinational DNA repair protein (RecF pathway)
MRNLACGIDPALLCVRFAWRWGNLWGTAPSLDSCSSCGRSIYDDCGGVVLRARTGLLCDRCVSGWNDEPNRDGAPYKLITPPVLRDMFMSATLPLDKFMRWAAADGKNAVCGEMEDCTPWLYSFL